MPSGSVSYIYYADRLNQLPLGLIGIGLGTVLLPVISRQLGEKREAEAMETQNRGMELALFLTLPYGKFAHGVYRSAALLRFAIEKRQPSTIAAASD